MDQRLWYRNRKRRISLLIPLLVGLYCLLLTGCRSSPVNLVETKAIFAPFAYSGPLDAPVASDGCNRESVVPRGVSTMITIDVDPASASGHATRSYRVYLPPSYSHHHPLPAVLVFHDYGEDSGDAEQMTGFSWMAERESFIAVYPQGLQDGTSKQPFWASLGPIDYGIDDVMFVSNVLDDLQSKVCVDAQRIYATGFSNGGGMVNLLACRLAGRIAAFAPVAGNYFSLPGGCRAERPVPLLEIHGTADSELPYNGIDATKNPIWPLPSIPTWLQGWARRDSCQLQPVVFLQTSAVTAQRWVSCRDNVSVVHYRLEHGRHVWPQTIGGRSGTGVIWAFLHAYTLSLVSSPTRNISYLTKQPPSQEERML